MSFDIKLIEPQLALEMIVSHEMPKIAWDALEAGLDGPATRRLAALERPTYFEVADVLPRVMQELGLSRITAEEAAIRMSRQIAQEILRSSHDPLTQLRSFESLYLRAHYPKSLAALGTLYDDVWIAQSSGQSEAEIRKWVTSTLSNFVRST